MLVIFDRLPAATPLEPMLHKKFVAEVAAVNLHGNIRPTFTVLDVRPSRSRFHMIVPKTNVGIVERVDVDGRATHMLRNRLGTRNVTEIETGSVVGRHRLFVRSIKIVNQPHTGNGVFRFVKLPENLQQILRNGFVADQFPRLAVSLSVPVLNEQVTKFVKKQSQAEAQPAMSDRKR